MSEYSKHILIGSTIAIIVGLSILVVVYLPRESNPSSIQVGHNSVEVTNATLGLELSISTQDNQIISPNDQIQVNLTVYNLKDTSNVLNVSKNWPLMTSDVDPCDSEFPISVGMVDGYYDSSNVSSVRASQLLNYTNPTAAYHCPLFARVFTWSFKPDSDLADNYYNAYTLISWIVTVNGTWTTTSDIPFSATHHRLIPDYYTVIAGDEWGQEALLHFEVDAD